MQAFPLPRPNEYQIPPPSSNSSSLEISKESEKKIQQLIQRRCNFVEDVALRIKGILNVVEDSLKATKTIESNNNEIYKQKSQEFLDSVKELCSIVHQEVDNTPEQPLRLGGSPYIDSLIQANCDEISRINSNKDGMQISIKE